MIIIVITVTNSFDGQPYFSNLLFTLFQGPSDDGALKFTGRNTNRKKSAKTQTNVGRKSRTKTGQLRKKIKRVAKNKVNWRA